MKSSMSRKADCWDNAPTESWNLRVVSVIRNSYGDPIDGYATFTLSGSVSGQPLDAYGAPITFMSNGTTKDNGILQVSITEGSTAFNRGDRFTIKVASRVLVKGDTLEARYIANQDLNDPEFFTDAESLYKKHGYPSLANTLSLGASMAFENGAFGVLALQAKPALPRRTSEVLVEKNDPLTASDEGYPTVTPDDQSGMYGAFNFPILQGVPGVDTEVHFFVQDKNSGEETQIFPTKSAFYAAANKSDPFNNFIASPDYSFSYTVIMDGQVEDKGVDGQTSADVFTANSAYFDAYNLDLGESDLSGSKKIRLYEKTNTGATFANPGLYTITEIVNSNSVRLESSVGTSTNLVWELVDTADESPRVLITQDLGTLGTIQRKDGLRVTYIDQDDYTFFDNNWAAAFEMLEGFDCQIVVPLPTSNYSAIQQAARAHCELMSDTMNRKERVLLTGAIMGLTADALVGRELVAVEDIGVLEGLQGDDPAEVLAGNVEDLQNYKVSDNWGGTFRAVYFFPDRIVRTVSGANTYIHGFYMAAAAGGLLAGTGNVALPLTKKILTGFSITRDRVFRPIILNELGNVGAAVVVPVTGGGQVLHGKTTTSSGAPEEEELSVVFIRDRVATVLRNVLQGFIGAVDDGTILGSITVSVQKTLDAMISQSLISGYRNLGVQRDAVDPRQWNVVVEIAPVLPVNWIFIDVSISA